MSEAKFTKGPWAVDPLGSEWIGSVFTADGKRQVAQAQPVKALREDLKQLERKANAHLIAAAPELYGELESALDLLVRLYDDPDIRALVREKHEFNLGVLQPKHAALTKARGEK